MPRSKHRRQPGGKAVSHPGRNKPARPIGLSWLDELEDETGISGLPLFDWAEQQAVRLPENPTNQSSRLR
jgi:hypothetical protein